MARSLRRSAVELGLRLAVGSSAGGILRQAAAQLADNEVHAAAFFNRHEVGGLWLRWLAYLSATPPTEIGPEARQHLLRWWALHGDAPRVASRLTISAGSCVPAG